MSNNIPFEIYKTGNKLSITGHSPNKIFVSTSGGAITTTTSNIDPTDLTNALIKLNGIEDNATRDQDASEIRALVEAAGNSNVFTDIDLAKLNGIEDNATRDQDASEIRALVEAAGNSNVFTDIDLAKLNGIEDNATRDQDASEIRALVEAAGNSNVFTDIDLAKLNGIEDNATRDQDASEIRALVEAAGNSNVFTDSSKVKIDFITITQQVNLDTVESTANSALQDFNGMKAQTIEVGGGADKTANYDFKFLGTAGNIAPSLQKYTTLRTPLLTADNTIVLPSDDGTLQLVNGSGDIITTAERTLISTNQTNIATNVTAIGTKLNATFSPYVGGMVLQSNGSGLIVESGIAYDTLTAIEDKTDWITVSQAVNLDTIETLATNAIPNSAISSFATAAQGTTADSALPASSVLDEDNFASNSATSPPSQQSTRVYVDTGWYSNRNAIFSNDTELARLNTHFTTTLVSERWFVKNNKIGCLGPIATVANNTTVIAESNLFFDTSDGSLPGQPANTNYPTIKTNYTTLYFSVSNKYTAYLQQIGTTPFVINFTGQHQALPLDEDLYNNVDDYVGKIVISNGDLSSFINDNGEAGISSGKRGIHINEAMPRVVLCNTYKDKRVFGVISNEEEDNETANMATRATEKHFRQGAFVSVIGGLPADDNRLFINALGEGAIWVINSHGNIENGDYICSSDKGEGYGCLQDDDLLHNYTCAKATINCSFDLESEEYECKEILINGENLRIAFIACVYCF